MEKIEEWLFGDHIILLIGTLQKLDKIFLMTLGDHWPLVSIPDELDPVLVPVSNKVFWPVFRWHWKVDYDTVVRVDPSRKEETRRFALTTNTFAFSESDFTIHLVKEPNDAEWTCMVWVRILANIDTTIVVMSWVVLLLKFLYVSLSRISGIKCIPDLSEQGWASFRKGCHQRR